MEELKTLDSRYFIGKSHFEKDGAQNYLAFQPMYRYFQIITGVDNGSYIYYWKCEGLSGEIINSIKTPSYSTTPNLDYYATKARVEFDGSCLKQDKNTFNYKKVVNIYIVYEISKPLTLAIIAAMTIIQHVLFGALSLASLTRNADIDKYKYSGYGIGFDRRSSFSFPSGEFGQNAIIFRVDMSSSTKIDNSKKDILILVKGPTEGLEHTLAAEKMYSINFSKWHTKFCLNLHYSGEKSLLMVKKIIKFILKDSEVVATPLCLGNISKDWSVDNMKELDVYDFSVNYDSIAVDNILDTHNYLMKKNDIL